MGTNTGLGIGIGIPFKNNALGGDKPYFPPELKARMIGVWTNYGKKNTDTDRNIIKNKIPNVGGDLEILNAAYKLNSGFGEYSEDFTTWTKSSKITSVDSESFDFVTNVNWNLLYYRSNIGRDIPSFKVRIKLKGEGKVFYNYITSEGVYTNKTITSEEYVTPISYNTKYTGETPVNCGFSIGIASEEGSGTITQIPNFEDAFVTDGINDMIVSQKTLQEMGVTKELTIVSMIHQISWRGSASVPLTNYIKSKTNEYVRSHVSNIGKTGIYGYVCYDISNSGAGNSHVVNTILGDKNDYSINIVGDLSQGKFSVQGYIDDNGNILETSSVAHYWTFAVLGKATEDEINLIIGNYNLDRSLKPDILCNIGKQGITNDNHADFNDKLIDYSGNGRDIQMYNLAWKGGSGVAAKNFETIKDYLIAPDKGLQELTIYNEFSYKVKSIKHADRYWTVQSLNKTDVSYPITIITDKDIIWRNILNYTDADGVEGNVKKETNVPANTPTQVFIYGFNDFDISDDYTKVNCVAHATRKDITEFTVTFIPSCKGGLLLDGVNDFGQFVGDLGLKDYTLIMNRAYNNLINNQVPLISSNIVEDQTPFIVEHWNTGSNAISFSYGASHTTDIPLDINKKIVYQSTYSYMGHVIPKGKAISTGNGITLGRFGNGVQYSAIYLWSLMLFPYSMSEFLIERQLKKHKLGTLYPDMVEFRPVIKANANYKITYYQIDSTNTWKSIKVGDYIVIGAKLAFQITFDNDASELKEVVSPQLSGIIVEKRPSNPGYNIYSYITSKSPQKINITIDEYIRFEDIVQPYPSLFTLIDYDTEEVYSWGSKLKVGARFKGNVVNLLPNMYEWQGDVLYNGEVLNWGINPGVVAKEMVFSWNMPFKYLIDNNEPKCILSPRLLRIPNSSYKILGYIPDISGHGNHGVIHNSAYTEGSGVNEDGSYQFDGVDDFVTIPTVTGGKQVLMKVNWQSDVEAVTLYDQRLNISDYEFAIYNGTRDLDDNPVMAYQGRNNGQTYIDGILNSNIMASELKAITHNITITNELSLGTNNTYPVIGSTRSNTHFAQMSLYDFMLFDDISTEDKIKELNEYVGIEAKVELPPYYWDTYGKTNFDADRDTIQQRGIAVGDYDLTNYNHAYNKISGYGGYSFKSFNDSQDWNIRGDGTGVEIVSRDGYSITIKKLIQNLDWQISNNEYKHPTILDKELPFKCVSNKKVGLIWQLKYKTEGATSDTNVTLINQQLTPNVPLEINLPYKTQDELTELGAVSTSVYYLLYFSNTTLEIGEEYTVEMLPLYPNALLYDAVTDYSENVNIPVFTDFTAIMKRKWLKNQGSPLIKGSKVYEGGNGNALLFEWDKAYNFVFYKRTDIMEGEVPDNISFITPTNYNGNVITRGSEQDTNGICIAGDGNAGFANIVFYKLILYPKTIPLLQINFLKNLMEKDEIIDLTNPIFIKDE